jgi:hypothetical protein
MAMVSLIRHTCSFVFDIFTHQYRSHTSSRDWGWKGGPLVLLACGLDPHVRAEAMADMDVPDGLSKSIGNTKAVLSRDERGRWGLETE